MRLWWHFPYPYQIRVFVWSWFFGSCWQADCLYRDGLCRSSLNIEQIIMGNDSLNGPSSSRSTAVLNTTYSHVAPLSSQPVPCVPINRRRRVPVYLKTNKMTSHILNLEYLDRNSDLRCLDNSTRAYLPFGQLYLLTKDIPAIMILAYLRYRTVPCICSST